jgi:hypothetical protein
MLMLQLVGSLAGVNDPRRSVPDIFNCRTDPGDPNITLSTPVHLALNPRFQLQISRGVIIFERVEDVTECLDVIFGDPEAVVVSDHTLFCLPAT